MVWLAVGAVVAVVWAVIEVVRAKTKPATPPDGAPKESLIETIGAVSKGQELVAKVQAYFQGLGIVQDMKTVKGDFDAAKALFLNRALSHEVAKIVRTEDKAKAAQLYADAALLIAASSAPATTPAE